MTIFNDLGVAVLHDEVVGHAEYAAHAWWQVVLQKYAFPNPGWFVPEQPLVAHGSARRHDIVVKKIIDTSRGMQLALVAAVEVKEARASLQIVMEVEEQVRSGCELYCDKERKERVWGLSCYGTRFRFWIYDHLVKGLQPVFPSTVPPGNKDFYLEFASNEDDFMGMCDTINQYAFPSIELLAGYLGTAFDAPDDTMELDPLEDIQDVARDL